MHYSKVAVRLRAQIAKFSGDVSAGLGKVAQRFVTEMIYGIMASESVLLTEIGRALEEKNTLKKTEERLSRNLPRQELEQKVSRNLLSRAAPQIGRDTLLVLDPSDISKKYAKKMENLATVRDGSEKTLGPGYWTLHVIGTEIGSAEIVPLYQRLYSQKAEDFTSENDELLSAIKLVREYVGQRGIWVMDRGGDRIKLFEPLLDLKLRFLFRLVGTRHLLYDGAARLTSEVAAGCRCPYAETVARLVDGQEQVFNISFGFRRVKLPERKEQLYLLVVNGFGAEPLMLLTTEPLRRNRKALGRMVRAYLKRWSIEETIRFIKQSYDLENVRVLNYPGLQNLMPLLSAVIYFTAVVLDTQQKLKIMAGYVLRAAKRIFGIPDFKYYALADGLQNIFKRHPGRPVSRKTVEDGQLALLFLADP
jgi:hypothetical protein